MEPTTLILPEKTRATLAESYADLVKLQAEFQKEQKAFQRSLAVACDFLGIDPLLPHKWDFEKGVITPAAAPAEPTPIRSDAAGG